mgnify:CR=1 FL=1
MAKNDLVANMTKAMGGSGKNKPQLPKGEGRGRIDDTHQVAVLTDLEAHALNTLRWEDKDAGYSSGSGPKIKALAAQNTRPFDFVEYKGEKIPTLNDSGDSNVGGDGQGGYTYTGGGAGGGDDGGSGGYQESAWARRTRLANEKKQAEARAAQQAEATRRQAEADRAARAREAAETERKRLLHQRHQQEVERRFEAIQRREQSTYTGQDSEELDYEAQENEDLNLDGSDIDSSGEGGSDPAFDQEPNYDEGEGSDLFDDSSEGFKWWEEGGSGIDPGEEPPDDPDPDPDPDDDDDGMSDEEFEAMAAELDLKPEYQGKDGQMYWTQGEADMVNARFDTARDTALGTLTDFGTGTYGTDYMSGLSENYRGEFADERQTAYDAALEGVYDDFKLSGVWDQTAYDEGLAAVDAGVLADNALLDPGATAYSDLAQGEFDTWLDAQTAEVQELYGGTDLSALSDWTFDVEGAEDDEGNITNAGLDLSAYDPESDNYNADLMDLEGQDFNFLEEFKRIYPSGTTTPGVTGDAGASGVDESTGKSSVRKTKKAKSKVPTYTSSPFGSGGSSSTIN